MTPPYDVAILGSGFAGSLLARLLARRGQRVLLVEKGRHPRFALGESSTPLAGFALERLAARYDLPDLHHLSTWGRWQRHLPHLHCGLKRGFTFYFHPAGEAFRNSPANEARLLVAASPNPEVADTHWLRADVDHHLVQEAVAAGVDYRDVTELDRIEIEPRGVRLAGHQGDARASFRAAVVVDATSAAGVLARALPIAAAPVSGRIRSGLLYAHFDNVPSFVEVARHGGAHFEPGPYPDEQAAVHHLVAPGWAYVLPFDHGVVSAGLVFQPGYGGLSIDALRRNPTAAWQQLLASAPTFARQFAGARPLLPIRFVPRLPYRLTRAAGPRWFLLPSSYAFYDPLFSTGIAWSLLAVERLATLLEHGVPSGDDGWRGYDQLLREEAAQIERLIAAAHLAMRDFELFTAVTFLYFVAASFAETCQRLAPPAVPAEVMHGFLGARDPLLRPLFAEALFRLEALAAAGVEPRPEQVEHFTTWMRESLAPRNVAGMADPARRNLYPLDLDVLVERAGLLGLERREVEAALPRLRGEV